MQQAVEIAEEAKSVLYELGAILNQRYRDRGPSHQTQQSLRRKNAVITRLDQFITDQQRVSELERSDGEDQKAAIERLEKQLEDQKATFEQERESLQQQATQTSIAQVKLRSSLDLMLPQLRELLEVYDREEREYADQDQGTTTRTVTIMGDTSNQDAARRLTTLQTSFDQERAQLLKKATDAANTQQTINRRFLSEREAVLTCPISLDLFENPVVTACCGKTFSSEALSQALRQSPQCPVCRAYGVLTHANRDMANLVEIHRAERSVLGLSESSALTFSATAARSNNTVTAATTQVTTAPETARQSAMGNRSTTASSRESPGYAARENNNRNQRSQRVQDRNAVPHRQPQRTAARRQEGRGYDSRRQNAATASSGFLTQAWQPSSAAATSYYYGLGPYGGTGYSSSDY